jgi:hypothetical protein
LVTSFQEVSADPSSGSGGRLHHRSRRGKLDRCGQGRRCCRRQRRIGHRLRGGEGFLPLPASPFDRHSHNRGNGQRGRLRRRHHQLGKQG